jgi:excisionase family DNA binding protein
MIQCTAIDNPDPLLSADGAAKYLGLDSAVKHPGHTVRRLVRVGAITAHSIAGHIMIRRSELDRYIETSRKVHA